MTIVVLEASPPGAKGSAVFRRLGKVVIRRRRYVILVWIIGLVAVLPALANEGKVTSLQQGSASGNQLESVKAGNIISAQFAKTVPNSTLVVVVSGTNVSSPATQLVVSRLVSSLRSDASVVGLKNAVDVYSILYSTVAGVNEGVYSTFRGANSTERLIFGVPALYLGVWQQAYAESHDISKANDVAYQQAASRLSSANATAFRLYSSHVLDLFNASWSASWLNPVQANYTIIQRASTAASTAAAAYFSNATRESGDFGRAVVAYFTLQEFLSDAPQSAVSRLHDFSVQYVSNKTGFSPSLVGSAYLLGPVYGNASLDALVGDMIWKPTSYGFTPQIESLLSSFVSPARDTTLVSLALDRSSTSNLLAIRAIAGSALHSSGGSGISSMLVTGGDALNYDFGNSTQDDLGVILPVTIVLLIVATGLFFRSVLTPFATLGTIGVALGISQIFIVLVGTYVAKVDFTIPTILVTVLIGVGTDYSVFVIARFREERVKGLSVNDALETSVTWAGESITTSGATVIISFMALGLTSIVFLRTMGIVVGLGVLVALSVALTLVPSIIAVVGQHAFWPNSGKRFASYAAAVLAKLERKSGYFSRSGALAVKRAGAVVVLAAIVSLPLSYVYFTSTPTYDFLSGAPSNLESISASNHLTQAFGGGRLFPSYVVVTFQRPIVEGRTFNSSEMAVLGSISSYLAGNVDVQNVTSPTSPFGRPVAYSNLSTSAVPDRNTFTAIMQAVGTDNRTALTTMNFGIDPYSSQAIGDAEMIRTNLHQQYDHAAGVTGVYLGGASGSILDTKNVFNSQFNSVLPIVAAGVALVLLVVLGSLFLPVFAVASVLMSIVWTLSITAMVFQAYYNYPLLFITPLFLFVTLLGLGMDYNIFILTRVREEATKSANLKEAIIRAIEQTGGIITAAAVILAGSLGSLMLSNDLLLKQLGFAFSFSILIDALFVRTYLVPAVMSTVGKWNWYNPIPFLKRSKTLFESSK